MKIEELKAAYGKDFVWELAQKETLSEFMECLKTKGICPDTSEAEVMMAVLYPLRGQKKELSEEELDKISGGLRPRSTLSASNNKCPYCKQNPCVCPKPPTSPYF